MMRRTLLLFFLLGPFLLSAQEKKRELTLKDAITKGFSDFRPQHVDGLQWIPNAPAYSYVKDTVLMRAGIGKMADQPLVTLATLNKGRTEKERMKGFPEITWKNADLFHFRDRDHVYAYDIPKATLVKLYDLPTDMEREDHDEAYQHYAYTKGENLYVVGGDMKPTPVTTDGMDGVVSGRSVHREEYGITKGTFWSPNGDKLAFYRMDERAVSPYMLEDINSKPSTFRKIRYPVAGDTSHVVTLGVFDRASRKTVFLQTTGAPDDYLTNICWDPTGKYVFVIHLNRATDHQRLVQYDATTGAAVKTLMEEDDKKWLEPMHPLTFLKKTPTQYIYWSEREGWMHLYLYDLNKGLVRALTPGNWVVKNIIGMDDKESVLFVEGTAMIDPKDPKGAMETHIYRIELKSGKVARLTQEPGTHNGQISTDGAFVIDQWSSLTVPGRTEIIDGAKGTVLKTLVNSTDPLANMLVGTIEFVKVPGENGEILNGRVVKPAGFDSRQQYPVLVYLYGGTHAQLVTNSFLGGASLWMLHAAQRGYVVFTMDGHGTENRGRDFEQAIYRQLGVVETKDQLRGVDWLKAQPWVDGSRLAVHGWSFGGHITTALLLRSPGTFKVGVAGGPVMDWGLYEVMYTERYMDTPAENPDGYAQTMHTDKAGQLRDHLLVIHGTIDDTVLPEHSQRFLKNSVDKGVMVDYFEYPGHPHNVRGKDRVHLMTKVLDYVDQYIGKGR